MEAPDPGIHNVPDNQPDSSHRSDTACLFHWCPVGDKADNVLICLFEIEVTDF